MTLDTVEGTTSVDVTRVDSGGPLWINLGGGAQIVNISPDDNNFGSTVLADVTVNPGTGLSTLNINDQNAPAHRNWTINGGLITSDIIGAGAVNFGRINDVELNAGHHGNTVTLQNTLNGLITDISVQEGDTVDVSGSGLGSTVNIAGPMVFINVGNGGHTSDFHGLLRVDSRLTSLSVDDSADSAGELDVVIDQSGIIGLDGGGDISYDDETLTALSLSGSRGGTVYHVHGTPIPFPDTPLLTTLICNGTDSVYVGDNGSLLRINSDLLIQNPGHFSAVTIDASADNTYPDPATITDGAVTGWSSGALRFDQSALSALNITGGYGETTYNVLSLPSYFLFPITTTINARAGDTVNLGQNGSLEGAWGNGSLVCNFSGAGPKTQVVLDGTHDAPGGAYTIGGNGNLSVLNATVGLGLTINGFRDQDQVVVDLPGGSVDADLTHTGPGSISLDGSARLLGTHVAAPLNTTIHARAVAGTIMPAGPITGILHAFNSVSMVGSMPQDTLHVYDSTNNVVVANDPIQAPYAQFAAASGDPMTVTVGQPFDFTVIAQDYTGATLANYNNQVQWYSYNPATGDYSSSNYEQFTPADQGRHIFHNIVLPVTGIYTLGFNDGWNVSSFTVTAIVSNGGHLDGESASSAAAPNAAVAAGMAQPAVDSINASAGLPATRVSLPANETDSNADSADAATSPTGKIPAAERSPCQARYRKSATMHPPITDGIASRQSIGPASMNFANPPDGRTAAATGAEPQGHRPLWSFRVSAIDQVLEHFDHRRDSRSAKRSHTGRPNLQDLDLNL